MKKSLSLLVAIAMVFSMFATVVSAAETEKTAGQYLNELGVIKGNGTDLKEDQTWKRKDVVILLAQLMGKTDEAKNAEKTHKFTDVTDKFYDGFISWVSEAKLMVGKSETKFGYNDELKNQDLFAIILRALDAKVEYADVPAAAIKYGFATEETDMNAIPLRGATYEVIVTALKTEVPGTGKTLEEVLGLVEVTVLALAKAEQTDNREITVSFNKAVNAEEKAAIKEITVKKGTISYTMTTKWAEDNKSVVLSSSFLPVGEYTVTLTGFDAKTVTIVEEKIADIKIGATSLQEKLDSQDLGVIVTNQFGKEVKNAKPFITAFNVNRVGSLTVNSGKVNLAPKKDDKNQDVEQAKIGDTVVVTATINTVTATKNLNVVAGSAATVIKFSDVQPLKDKTRITAGEKGLVLPIELIDQYGNAIKLAKSKTFALNGQTVNVDGIFITFSHADMVEKVYTDKDGKLLFDIKAGLQQATTVIVNAVNPATSANANTTFKVETAAVVKTLEIVAPASQIVIDEATTFKMYAVDQFGQEIPSKDLASKALTFTVGDTKATKYVNAKGELVVTFKTKGTTFITASTNGMIVGSLYNLTVQDVAKQVKINGIKNVTTTLVEGASVGFAAGNIDVIDNYDRVATVAASTYKVEVAAADQDIVKVENGKITGYKAGSAEITISLNGVENSEFKFTVDVVKASDVKEYAIKTIGKVHADNKAGTRDTEVFVEGKLNGNSVALVSDVPAKVTSFTPGVIETIGNKLNGLKAGTTTVKAFDAQGNLLGEQEVTVSDEAPVATTVKFEKDSLDILTATSTAGTVKLTVKDQYGFDVVYTPDNFTTTNAAVAKVTSVNDGVVTVTGNETGIVTINYIASNGIVATLNVAVN